MIIDKERNTITFELSKEEIDRLELALSITRINPELYFKNRFLRMIYHEALRMTSPDEDHIFPERLYIRSNQDKDRLLLRWSQKRELVNHNIFKAYFILSDKNEKVDVQALEEEFIKQYLVFDELGNGRRKFLYSFRQLCSDSEYTYGKFFDYNRVTKEVKLDESKMELILKYKDDFLDLNKNK